MNNDCSALVCHEPLVLDFEIPEHGKEKKREIAELTSFLSIFGKYHSSTSVLLDQEKKELRYVVKGLFTTTLHFDKLFVFDDTNVKGLPSPTGANKKGENFVIDWLSLNDRRRSESVSIIGYSLHWQYPSRFISDILFYTRPGALREEKKDVVVFSHLYDEELENFDFAEVVVRIFVDDLVNSVMKIPGEIRYSRGKGYKEGRSRYPIYISNERRDIISLQENQYDDTDSIQFMIGRKVKREIGENSGHWMNRYHTFYRKEQEHEKSIQGKAGR